MGLFIDSFFFVHAEEEGGVDVKSFFSSVSPHFSVNLKKGNFMISV